MEKIAYLERTCSACPDQYEGELEDGSAVYIRMRHGYGRLDINGETAATLTTDDQWQGVFEEGQLEQLIADAGLEMPDSIN